MTENQTTEEQAVTKTQLGKRGIEALAISEYLRQHFSLSLKNKKHSEAISNFEESFSKLNNLAYEGEDLDRGIAAELERKYPELKMDISSWGNIFQGEKASKLKLQNLIIETQAIIRRNAQNFLDSLKESFENDRPSFDKLEPETREALEQAIQYGIKSSKQPPSPDQGQAPTSKKPQKQQEGRD